MAPIAWALQNAGRDFRVVFTGQAFSPGMGADFFEEMRYFPENIIGNLHQVTSWEPIRGFIEIQSAVDTYHPSAMVAQGDTHTVGLAAMVALASGIPLVHVEAGLRSFDRQMLEERYRRLADEAAQLLFVPCGYQLKNLRGVLGQAFCVGNTIVDVLKEFFPTTSSPDGHVLITLHRRELITDSALFNQALQSIAAFLRTQKRLGLFPLHPHTAKLLPAWAREHDYLRITAPISYTALLGLLRSAALVLTDSGGIQEEACVLGIPCGILRPNTERWETIRAGAAKLLNPLHLAQDPKLLETVSQIEAHSWKHPYGSNVGLKIVEIMERYYA